MNNNTNNSETNNNENLNGNVDSPLNENVKDDSPENISDNKNNIDNSYEEKIENVQKTADENKETVYKKSVDSDDFSFLKDNLDKKAKKDEPKETPPHINQQNDSATPPPQQQEQFNQQYEQPNPQDGFPPNQQYEQPNLQGSFPPNQQYGQPNQQGGFVPNQQYGQPNQQGGFVPNQQYRQPNPQGGFVPNQQYRQPNQQGGFVPNQQYRQPNPQGGFVPNQQYRQPNQQGGFVPNQQWQQQNLHQHPYYTYPVPPKKKMGKKQKGFLWTFFILLSLLIVGYIIYLGFNISKSTSNPNIVTPTSPTVETEKNEEILTNPKDNGIVLNPLPKDKSSEKYNIQSAYEKVSPSVVGIACYNNKTDAENSEKALSQGTGIIIRENGYIVTNSHVIFNSNDYYIQIILSNGKKYHGKVVGIDSRTDLALLKIDENKLPIATFGNSDLIRIGDDVVAIGNPGGINYQNSLTKGIVSAVNRSVSTSKIVKYIQTDAPINPGNSGGPLCNIYGQIVGINTVKIIDPMFEGMGFAIPSNLIKEIVDDLIKNGHVEGRVRIGISGIDVSTQMQNFHNLPKGVLIESISEDGPLYGKDIKKGDVLTKIGGEDIESIQDIYSVLSDYKAGDKVMIQLHRPSNKGNNDSIFINIELEADYGNID